MLFHHFSVTVQYQLGVALVQALLLHQGEFVEQILVRVFQVISLIDELFYIMVDVFASFIRGARRFRLTGSLKGYLTTCVANRARNVNRAYRVRHVSGQEKAPATVPRRDRPDRWIIQSDELRRLNSALAKLPYDQRETVIMRAQLGMKFGQIAESQRVSSKTAQSRYRIGLDKLRSLLNGEAL